MKRYDIEMNGDDMLTEEAPDGRWVDADEALARIAELEAVADTTYATLVRVADEKRAAKQKLADAEQKLANGNALLRGIAGGCPGYAKQIEAHLAAQPAAPSRGDGDAAPDPTDAFLDGHALPREGEGE